MGKRILGRNTMGTWEAGIFDDDLAMDIRDEFEEAID
jgi:hypothetical protein